MRIALIGLGMVAETHVRALRDAPGLHLAGILGRDPARTRAFAERIGPLTASVPRVYPDVAAVAASDVDFVLLCTPPDARTDIVATLAAAGKPIMMEKPVGRTTEAATRLVDICEAAGVPLGVVFQHRLRPASRALAALCASGRLGSLAAVEISVPWWRDQGYYDAPGRGTLARDGGGVLMTQVIHSLDLALTFTGPVARVQAMARTTRLHRMETEDFVTAGLDFVNGAVGSLTASTASRPGGAERITLHCARGSARLTAGQLTVDWADGSSETAGQVAASGGGADPMAFSHADHTALIADFADTLRRGHPPACTGRNALQVHALIDAILRSSTTGRAVEL